MNRDTWLGPRPGLRISLQLLTWPSQNCLSDSGGIQTSKKKHQGLGASELAASDFRDLAIVPADSQLLTGEIPVVLQEQPEEPEGQLVIRSKEFEKNAMTKEEAVSHMELVGHDFYLYHDLEHDKAAVVYRRKAYSYGVISLS